MTNEEQNFSSQFKQEQAKYNKRPNILICGYTGSGKSSLARTILGDDIVSKDCIGDGAPKTMGYDKYENELIRIWDSKGLELGETEVEFTTQTKKFVRSHQDDPNVNNHIHLVWYTIQGPGARVTDCDKNLIKNIFPTAHLIVVITKTDSTRANQKKALLNEILSIGIPKECIIFTSDEEGGALGCKDLVAQSEKMLPEAYKSAFIEKQKIDLDAKINSIKNKSTKANVIIGSASAAAVAIGINPIPLSDALLLVPTQVTMIASLAALYNLKDEAIKQSALPFVAKLAGMFTASSLLKFIPFAGSAINGTVAGTITSVMGLYVKNIFEKTAIAKVKGEPMPEIIFDPQAFKEFYKANK